MVPGTNKVDPANHNQLGADTDVLSQLRSGAVEFFTPPSVHSCPSSDKPAIAIDCRGRLSQILRARSQGHRRPERRDSLTRLASDDSSRSKLALRVDNNSLRRSPEGSASKSENAVHAGHQPPRRRVRGETRQRSGC